MLSCSSYTALPSPGPLYCAETVPVVWRKFGSVGAVQVFSPRSSAERGPRLCLEPVHGLRHNAFSTKGMGAPLGSWPVLMPRPAFTRPPSPWQTYSGDTTLGYYTEASLNTTSTSATCQTASGLSLCSAWNGQDIGTCYDLADIDTYAQQIVDAFGGDTCAVDWACAAIATCYFSSNEKHWCAWTNRSVCEDAFDSCSVTHIAVRRLPITALETAIV